MEQTTPILEQPQAVPQLSRPKSKKGLLVLIVVIVIILLLIVVWLKLWILSGKTFELSGSSKTWKAVFLTNGQVFFGKVVKETKETLVLHNIYYLQVQQLTTEQSKEQQPQFTLIKLGEEIHGPTNEMRINRDHILFVETLKPNSRVVQTIESTGNR
ncbi:MAG: hypothetical protein ACP5IX_01345 [Patescibacteria group bacterium]